MSSPLLFTQQDVDSNLSPKERRRLEQQQLLQKVNDRIKRFIGGNLMDRRDSISGREMFYGEIAKHCISTLDGELKVEHQFTPDLSFATFKVEVYDVLRKFVKDANYTAYNLAHFGKLEFSYLMGEVAQCCLDSARGRSNNPFE